MACIRCEILDKVGEYRLPPRVIPRIRFDEELAGFLLREVQLAAEQFRQSAFRFPKKNRAREDLPRLRACEIRKKLSRLSRGPETFQILKCGMHERSDLVELVQSKNGSSKEIRTPAAGNFGASCLRNCLTVGNQLKG